MRRTHFARVPGVSLVNRAGNQLIRAVLVLVTGVLLAVGGLLAPPAWAAAGDYTAEITAPATVSIYDGFNYTVTVAADVVAGPVTGVVLTATLPVGIDFDSVPADANSPVAAATWDPATRQVAFKLKDLAQPLSSFVFSVKQLGTNGQLSTPANIVKYPGQELAVTLAGSATRSGLTPTAVAKTILTGDMNYRTTKTFTTVLGSDNRTVTYTVNGSPVDSTGSSKTFFVPKQTIKDVLPAGARVLGSVPGTGAWSFTDNSDGTTTALWTGDSVRGPANSLSYVTGDTGAKLTVYYPESVFPIGTRPPVNTSEMTVWDANGASWPGGTAKVQGPAFVTGTTQQIMVQKSSTDASASDDYVQYSGYWLSSYLVKASYLNSAAPGDNLASLIVQDAAAEPVGNAEFLRHAELKFVRVRFNEPLVAVNAPVALEYTTNTNRNWQRVDAPTITTAADVAYIFQPTGTVGAQRHIPESPHIVNLPVGQYPTGWRVVVSEDAATSLPGGSEVRVEVNFAAVATDLVTGAKAAEDVVVTNTVTARGISSNGVRLVASDPTTIRIQDRVNLMTYVAAPTTLQVGTTATIRAGIANLDPAGRSYSNTVMKVVLPVGVSYDSAVGVSRVSPTAANTGVSVPEVGKGVTISTEVLNTGGVEQDVVVFTFDSLASIRTAGQQWDRDEANNFRYDIAVQVLPQAYQPSTPQVPTVSWAYTNDPRYAGMPQSFWEVYYAADIHKFGRTADNKIASWTSKSVVTTAGGLLIGKQVRADDTSHWSVSATVTDTAQWQLYLINVLPKPVTDIVLFDRLPVADDGRGSQFGVTLAGPVSGLPDGATVEYSADATTATDGRWTAEPVGATAFRVRIPSMTQGVTLTLQAPTTVPPGISPGAHAHNAVQATGIYDGRTRTFDSNTASIVVRGGTLSVSKVVDGDGAAALPAGTVFTVSYTSPDGTAAVGTLTLSADGSAVVSPEIAAGTQITLQEINLPDIAGISWGQVQYVVGGGQPSAQATFTIVANAQVEVKVINTATVAPTPTPTPTDPTPTPTPTPTDPTPTPTPTVPPTNSPAPTPTPPAPTPSNPPAPPPSNPPPLPNTGFTGMGSFVTGLGLLIAGTVVLLFRRRRLHN